MCKELVHIPDNELTRLSRGKATWIDLNCLYAALPAWQTLVKWYSMSRFEMNTGNKNGVSLYWAVRTVGFGEDEEEVYKLVT